MSGRGSDGRALAVKLLKRMRRLNGGCSQDVRASRDLMMVALEKFADLPVKEKARFGAILTDAIASAYAGFQTEPWQYDQSRCEATYMGMATKGLRYAESLARASKVH